MQKTVDKDVGRDRFAAAQTLQHIERLTGEHLEILLNGRQRRLHRLHYGIETFYFCLRNILIEIAG